MTEPQRHDGGSPQFARGSLRKWGLRLSERRVALGIGDLACLNLALWAALWLRPGTIAPGLRLHEIPVPLYWWLVLSTLWIPSALIADCYNLSVASNARRGPVRAMACAGVVSAVYLVIPIISAPLVRSRFTWFLFAAAAMALVGLWRLAYAALLGGSHFVRHALAVGAGRCGQELAQALKTGSSSYDTRLVGFVDDNAALAGSAFSGVPVLGSGDALQLLVERHHIEDIVLAITEWGSIRPALMSELVACWQRGSEVIPMPLYYEEVLGALPVRHLGQNLFALVGQRGSAGRNLWSVVRRALDLAFALVALVIALPFFPLVAALILLDSPGPVLYRQRRVGRGGEEFWVPKLRSMVRDAETNGAIWAREGDQRVTRMGRFLRRTHVDELPQLWTILLGHMTLIGPRPERPEFVRQLEQVIPYYNLRHAVRPGLTGWAQVCYRYGNSIEDAVAKFEYDLYYLKNRGPLLDALIFLRTLRVVALMKGM